MSDSPSNSPGAAPADGEPINSFFQLLDSLLRKPILLLIQIERSGGRALVFKMMVLAVIFSFIYGLVVGSFSMGAQLWMAPLKVAGGMLLSVLICFPSLYIFLALSGSKARLPEVAGLISGLFLMIAVLLIGLA